MRASVMSARSGIFGPPSAIWRIDREAAIFLGAGRALLLQLAHPWVAAAIDQHSHTFADPIERFHRTFGIVFNMVFGSLENSLAVARQLHSPHARKTAHCRQRQDLSLRVPLTLRIRFRRCDGYGLP